MAVVQAPLLTPHATTPAHTFASPPHHRAHVNWYHPAHCSPSIQKPRHRQQHPGCGDSQSVAASEPSAPPAGPAAPRPGPSPFLAPAVASRQCTRQLRRQHNSLPRGLSMHSTHRSCTPSQQWQRQQQREREGRRRNLLRWNRRHRSQTGTQTSKAGHRSPSCTAWVRKQRARVRVMDSQGGGGLQTAAARTLHRRRRTQRGIRRRRACKGRLLEEVKKQTSKIWGKKTRTLANFVKCSAW